MKVSFVSGPNAGQSIHIPRDRFSDLLIQAGVLELLEEDKPRPAHSANAESASIANHTVPEWGIFTSPRDGAVAIQCNFMRETRYYTGDPALAHTFKVGPHTVPLEVAMEYMNRKAKTPEPHDGTLERDINERQRLVDAGGGTRA